MRRDLAGHDAPDLRLDGEDHRSGALQYFIVRVERRAGRGGGQGLPARVRVAKDEIAALRDARATPSGDQGPAHGSGAGDEYRQAA